MRTLEKAEEEVARGNLWRAKEILQGAIPNAGYDAELFEKLGLVLLRMGDLPEAGRFLFLSGAARAEYETAVALFLRRHGKNSHHLYRSFPRPARLATLAEYPPAVAGRLRELGSPELLRTAEAGRPTEAGSNALAWVTCLTLALAVVALIVLGIVKLRELAL